MSCRRPVGKTGASYQSFSQSVIAARRREGDPAYRKFYLCGLGKYSVAGVHDGGGGVSESKKGI